MFSAMFYKKQMFCCPGRVYPNFISSAPTRADKTTAKPAKTDKCFDFIFVIILNFMHSH